MSLSQSTEVYERQKEDVDRNDRGYGFILALVCVGLALVLAGAIFAPVSIRGSQTWLVGPKRSNDWCALRRIASNVYGAGPAECSPRLLNPTVGRSLSAGGLDRPARHLGSRPHACQLGPLFCPRRPCARARVSPIRRADAAPPPSRMLRASVYRWSANQPLTWPLPHPGLFIWPAAILSFCAVCECCIIW
jgi:hypothetical protein